MTKFIRSITELKQLEKVSPNVSDKYVPIKTSDFIEALSNFDFLYATKYVKGSNMHSAVLSCGEGTNIVIENSYDRRLAFSIYFEHEGVLFGKVRQVHIGKSAQELAHMEGEVNEFYTNAIQTLHAMKNLQLDADEYREIARVGFKARSINIDETDFQVQDINAENCFEFMQGLILILKMGEFNRKHSTRKPQLVKSQAKHVKICNQIWQHIAEEHPELQI